MCGETIRISLQFLFRMGLSPRVRGNRLQFTDALFRSGSIPACAGKPSFWHYVVTLHTVYPRVCGETPRALAMAVVAMGLSPRVRGNHDMNRPKLSGEGSIPACAGKPPRGRRMCRQKGVYPRVCGETSSSIVSTVAPRGLSPRVRGNLLSLAPGAGPSRSIPACAGKPTAARDWKDEGRVYPRVCGETGRAAAIIWRRRGLSPRVRGNRWLFGTARISRWSIPACAGKPPGTSIKTLRTWVYPRVCGETTTSESTAQSCGGLSPRVRGNH